MRIAYQGEPGAYSEEAVHALYPDAAPHPCPSFEAVFGALAQEAVARAVIPIENTLFGSVHVNYDLLLAHDVRIVAERWQRIRHHLLAPPGATLEGLRRVHSHPQALGQCGAYLRARLPHAEAVPAYDTAGAAQAVAAAGDPAQAAIASARAAETYGLAVLDAGLETDARNYTRFLALARPGDAPPPPGNAAGCKTSVCYHLRENVPGALFKSLAAFALRELDLYKIESRPLVGSPGRYLFYLDVAGAATDPPLQRALGHIAELTDGLRVLGTYPAAPVGG